MDMRAMLLGATACTGFGTAASAVTLLEERDSESTTSMCVEDGRMQVQTVGVPATCSRTFVIANFSPSSRRRRERLTSAPKRCRNRREHSHRKSFTMQALMSDAHR